MADDSLYIFFSDTEIWNLHFSHFQQILNIVNQYLNESGKKIRTFSLFNYQFYYLFINYCSALLLPAYVCTIPGTLWSYFYVDSHKRNFTKIFHRKIVIGKPSCIVSTDYSLQCLSYLLSKNKKLIYLLLSVYSFGLSFFSIHL